MKHSVDQNKMFGFLQHVCTNTQIKRVWFQLKIFSKLIDYLNKETMNKTTEFCLKKSKIKNAFKIRFKITNMQK